MHYVHIYIYIYIYAYTFVLCLRMRLMFSQSAHAITRKVPKIALTVPPNHISTLHTYGNLTFAHRGTTQILL